MEPLAPSTPGRTRRQPVTAPCVGRRLPGRLAEGDAEWTRAGLVGVLSVAILARNAPVTRHGRKRQPRCSLRSLAAPPLEDTLIQVFQDGVQVLGGDTGEELSGPRPQEWKIEEEEDTGALYYGRFRVDGIPPRQGATVGNTLRRTLLRQDLFRTYAAVAFRLRYRSYNVDQGKVYVSRAQPALHEFASVPGVQESMIDVVRSVQQLTVAKAPWEAPPDLPLSGMASEHPNEPDVWRWATRRCGPCPVKAQDLDMVDSSAFYESPTHLPLGDQHLLQISAPAMIEFEVEATRASQSEWEMAPAFEEYRKRLRCDRWLLVPPLFSPVRKVNYMVTAGEDSETESVQLELWTTKAARPSYLVRTSAASLLASLVGRRADDADDAVEMANLAEQRQTDDLGGDEPYMDDDPYIDDDQDALDDLLSSAIPTQLGTSNDGDDEGMRALTEGLFDV
ncbi:rpoA [Symbiodinium natans]|uniref:RpoA protein n=1 Tax=Symbiodinium natans TaxID=878477 RepID=A0A812SPK4_9DINO|nr:rpoA [Symbiodinium natans]